MRLARADSSLLACLAALVALGQVLCGCLTAAGATVPDVPATAHHAAMSADGPDETELPCPSDGCEHCEQSDTVLPASAHGDDEELQAALATPPVTSSIVAMVRTDKLGWPPRAPPDGRALTPIFRFDTLLV